MHELIYFSIQSFFILQWIKDMNMSGVPWPRPTRDNRMSPKASLT